MDIKPGDKVSLVSIGQKLTGEGEDVKAGQTALLRAAKAAQRLTEIQTENAGPVDAALYYDQLNTLLGSDSDDLSLLSNYGHSVQNRIETLEGLLTSETGFWSGGERKEVTPAQVAADIQKQLGGRRSPFTASDLPKPLLDIIWTTDEKGEKVLRDFSDPKEGVKYTRYLKEAMARVTTMTKLKRDLRSNTSDTKRGAQLFLTNAAALTIMDTGSLGTMSQLVITESGESFSFDQNDVIQLMTEARNNNNLAIDVDGLTTHFTFPIGNGQTASFILRCERQGQNPSFIGYTPQETARNIGGSVRQQQLSQPINADVMYQYLKGQHQLLETLFSRTT